MWGTTITEDSSVSGRASQVIPTQTRNECQFPFGRSAVLEHEQFQEMCAAASVGQLSPDQLAALERHMADCADCRSSYADYSQIAGLEYSLREHDTTLDSVEANKYVDSALLRRRFLARAENEGILFSNHVDRTLACSNLASFPTLPSTPFPTPLSSP